MVNILLDNEQDKVEIGQELKELIKLSIEETLKYENVEKDSEVSFLLIDNDEIKFLNNEYREKDEATDVLSFPMYEDISECDEDVILLGDVVISCERAIEQAEEFNHSVNREIGYLTVHSILHLLGYDHMNDEEKAIMREKEEAILEKINLVR